MNILLQAIRALDPRAFELLIFYLMRERYPEQNVKHIEGSAGDQGVDVISGFLDDRPTIWQCKAFSAGIKDSQKNQIRNSLKRALPYFKPKRWVLCISCDMDSKALRWFQRLQKSNEERTEIDMMQASDIAHQLLYYKIIRNMFFPSVVLDTSAIREAIAGTDKLTTEELDNLTSENVEIYLERLRSLDARFSYAVTFTSDTAPARSVDPRELLSLSTAGKSLQVFPRDCGALQESPPRVNVSLVKGGVDKLNDLLKTGRPQEIDAEEIASFSSDFDFLLPSDLDRKGLKLKIRQCESSEVTPLRVTFGKGDSAVIYEYISFRRKQAGSDEATLESDGELPFRLQLVLRKDGTGRFSLEDSYCKRNVVDVQKAFAAIDSAIANQSIELYDLRRQSTFLKAKLRAEVPPWLEAQKAIVDDAVNVSAIYGVQLYWPQVVTVADVDALRYLQNLVRGVTLSVDNVCLKLVKIGDIDIRHILDENIVHELASDGEEINVFGTSVKTGPLRYEIGSAQIENAPRLMNDVKNLNIGGAFELVLKPKVPIRIQLVRDVDRESGTPGGQLGDESRRQ